MKRYNLINSIYSDKSNLVDYKLDENIDFGESLVDKSHFVPIAEAVASLNQNANAAHIDDLNYDFADGRDDGRSIPSSRNPHNREITQQYLDTKDLAASAANAYKKGVKKVQVEQDIANFKNNPQQSEVNNGTKQ